MFREKITNFIEFKKKKKKKEKWCNIDGTNEYNM